MTDQEYDVLQSRVCNRARVNCCYGNANICFQLLNKSTAKAHSKSTGSAKAQGQVQKRCLISDKLFCMSRPVRIQFEGALYHITSRGDRREAIYKDDEDRSAFLKTLGEVTETFNWICHAYCLMTNHYHLVIETPDGNLSKGMRQLNGVYTQASNRRHQRTGHLFQG